MPAPERNADVTQTVIDNGIITDGYITLSVGGNIKSGQTAYETGIGFWLGNDGGTPKFSIGNTTNYFKWTGSAISMLCSGVNAIIIDYGSDILLKEGGDLKFTSVTAPTACTGALAGAGAGNVDDGTHKYKVTYVNDAGETDLGAVSNTVTVVDKSSDGKVSLTGIPVSGSSSVIARKIYRTKAGGSDYYLLATISDNTTTIYTDNTADASLTGFVANFKKNDSFGKIIVDNVVSFSVGNSNTLMGYEAGLNNDDGYANTFIGSSAGHSNLNGSFNVFLGNSAGDFNTGGDYNTFIGVNAGRANAIGDKNTFIGSEAGNDNTEGEFNVFLGNGAGYDSTTGDFNVFLGTQAGRQNMTENNNTYVGSWAGYVSNGDSNVMLGYSAGFWETGSNKLFIDNQARANEADGRVKALIYGVFNATALSQQITFNVGTLNILDGGNIATGTGTGLKIGTATSQLLGFYNATPVDQPATVADATDAADVILRCNDIIDRLQELGLIA